MGFKAQSLWGRVKITDYNIKLYTEQKTIDYSN